MSVHTQQQGSELEEGEIRYSMIQDNNVDNDIEFVPEDGDVYMQLYKLVVARCTLVTGLYGLPNYVNVSPNK